MTKRCEGKLALVTGGAQGLGRAHCIRLAQEGARVLATDINGAGAQETADIVNAEMGDGTAFAIAHDVTDPAQWEAAVDAAREQLGGLNVLVNNAGIGVAGNIEDCTFEDWKRCYSVNVDSIFHGCQKALPLMREHAPGSIINISSIAGLIASDTMPAYNSTKAAVWMLSKSIALHCAKKNMQIRCNSVHPTFVDTPILDGTATAHALDKDVLLEKLARQIPLRFVGEPNDIANAVVYLASDESRFMTGAEIKLDGGISAM
ncbi:NAD(P)-dependent dehydrogenase, short-chain alcohol dehydrogenase family [Erythrobacter litoralis]|uniref:3-beta hydroxysteroid dehydrogenase n=1 Tax=Erythrobacter litoralis TaxID=39960 RepID=A0A074MI53_9SPHN|nr:SDR family oxidoreductase [Erythrobacter litoralis]AOL23000.1 NAD(P)-dependent dehydrogenase, short-chain alcohol dehydrogenase family [Erythrobacter litoralis]KEO93134.1 3-beta hydroxysteroid dehydrogenase [Erythrobacter litoralis]